MKVETSAKEKTSSSRNLFLHRTATSTSSRILLSADEKAIVEQGARVHGDQGRADHQQVLDRGFLPVRAAAGVQGAEHRRTGNGGIRVPRRKPASDGPDRDGDGACGLFDLGLLRHPQRHGDRLNLRRRLGGAEAEVAAADGPPREDRLLRPDRAARGLRGEPRPA